MGVQIKSMAQQPIFLGTKLVFLQNSMKKINTLSGARFLLSDDRNIGLVRARLNIYRSANSVYGKPLYWIDVAQRILDSPHTALSIPEKEQFLVTGRLENELPKTFREDLGWPIRGEALRRFGEGATKFVRGKKPFGHLSAMQAIIDFLVSERLLNLEEFERDSEPRALGLLLTKAHGKTINVQLGEARVFYFKESSSQKLFCELLLMKIQNEDVVEARLRIKYYSLNEPNFRIKNDAARPRAVRNWNGWGIPRAPNALETLLFDRDDNSRESKQLWITLEDKSSNHGLLRSVQSIDVLQNGTINLDFISVEGL